MYTCNVDRVVDRLSTDATWKVIQYLIHSLKYFIAFIRVLFSKYESATQNDLWEHLSVAASEGGTLPEGVTVKDIMDAWTLQAGYPVVHVMRTSDGSSATVTKVIFISLRGGSVFNIFTRAQYIIVLVHPPPLLFSKYWNTKWEKSDDSTSYPFPF